MLELPHMDRAIGLPTPEHSHQLRFEEKLTELYNTQDIPGIQEYEITKTERDNELLATAQDAVDHFLMSYGRKKHVEVPLERLHIVNEGGVEKVTKGIHKGAPPRQDTARRLLTVRDLTYCLH